MLPLFSIFFHSPLFPSSLWNSSTCQPDHQESEVRIWETKRHGESCGQPALKRLGRKKSTKGVGFARMIGQLEWKKMS